MKIIAPAVVLLASIGLAWPASASSLGPMFNVVDLGPGYQLQADSTGATSGVRGAGGGMAYAFDKSPTTSIDQQYYADGVSQFPYLHEGGFLRYTLQNGSFKGGYYLDPFSGQMAYPYFPHVPIGFYFMASWHNEMMPPVADMNAHGEIVGTSVLGATSNYGAPTYAAFSSATGKTHVLNNLSNSSVDDNLNNYINTIPGVSLTSAVKVDDLGRIIAGGSNGHDYLVTPDALGSPSPVPEPSTLALLAVASAGWVARRRFRR